MMPHHPVVPREAWLDAQKAHLKIEKAYVFDAPEGERTLGDLFDGNSQLIVHHLMFHPDWAAACPGCSFQADHIDGPRPHLARHGVTIVAVSRAPIGKIEAYRRRMGWRFPWVSSGRSGFNRDFHVTFRQDEVESGRIDYNFETITVDPRYRSEELPGVSVFCRDEAGDIFLTQSIYARGLDLLIGASHYLDITPKGRNETDAPNWVRRRDEYDDAGTDGCHAAASA